MMTEFSIRSLVWAALLALCGCVHMEQVPELNQTETNLPPIAAQYRTTFLIDDDHEKSEREVSWRIWREPTIVVTENLDTNTGEVWQRDGSTLFHQKVFHSDRKSVSYQMDDLAMNGVRSSSLARQALLVEPDLIAQLKLEKSGWRDGYPFRRYAGTLEGQRWDVTIRTDLNIATRIQRRTESLIETTVMDNVYPSAAAPWQPQSIEGYEVIEFADFGDRQEDPFVAKVQAQLGKPHTH